VLQERYERVLVGEQGVFNIWGYKTENYIVHWVGPMKSHQSRPQAAGSDHPIWDSVRSLRKQGLLTFVPHLWETDVPSQAEIIHSYGIGASGESIEVEMGTAAHQAALVMVPEFKIEKAFRDGYYHFAPVANTIPKVQMIGVARLRYRPHTARTRDWYGDLWRGAPKWLQKYAEIQKEAKNRVRKSA
jgi:hypothetical protein